MYHRIYQLSKLYHQSGLPLTSVPSKRFRAKLNKQAPEFDRNM
jgi:hypothetical protein